VEIAIGGLAGSGSNVGPRPALHFAIKSRAPRPGGRGAYFPLLIRRSRIV